MTLPCTTSKTLGSNIKSISVTFYLSDNQQYKYHTQIFHQLLIIESREIIYLNPDET